MSSQQKQFDKGDRVFTPDGRGTVQDHEFIPSQGSKTIYVALDSNPQEEQGYKSSQLKRDK